MSLTPLRAGLVPPLLQLVQWLAPLLPVAAAVVEVLRLLVVQQLPVHSHQFRQSLLLRTAPLASPRWPTPSVWHQPLQALPLLSALIVRSPSRITKTSLPAANLPSQPWAILQLSLKTQNQILNLLFMAVVLHHARHHVRPPPYLPPQTVTLPSTSPSPMALNAKQALCLLLVVSYRGQRL